MSEEFMRVWKKFSTEEVRQRLLNIGDSLGNCENCKELGLDYKTVEKCPSCGTEFKYMTSKNASGGSVAVVKRLHSVRERLIFVDYDDYKKGTGRNEAKKFFKD